MAGEQVAFFKGGFHPLSDAKVSVRCKALNYGLGCFEGIRAYWSKQEGQLYIFRAEDHYERLLLSTKIVHLKLNMSVAQLVAATVELLRRNAPREDTYIRPLVFNNSEAMSPQLTDDPAELAIYTLPLRDYLDVTKGVTACVSSWRRVSDNMIPARAKPTAAYMNSALARLEAKENGYDEAIFLTNDGYVSEGSAEHIFIVREGKLITPSSQEDNLDGITRRTLCQIAPELGFEVVVRRISRTELYVADEAFFCGTGAEVCPLVSVDRRPVGNGKPGPITLELQKLFWRVVRAEVPKFADWCKPVYPK